MASEREIIKIWKEFDHDFYLMAEELADLRESSQNEINELKKEMEDHVCKP